MFITSQIYTLTSVIYQYHKGKDASYNLYIYIYITIHQSNYKNYHHTLYFRFLLFDTMRDTTLFHWLAFVVAFSYCQAKAGKKYNTLQNG